MLIPIDFEYRKSQEKYLDLVCCSYVIEGETKSYWLFQDDKEKERLKEDLESLGDMGAIFLAYNVIAEGRSFISLGLDPLDFNWYDLYLEYRCLTNHNHKLMYGRQLINGKIKYTKPPKPKWERTEEDEKHAQNDKPQHGLGAATFKLLNVKIDNKFKDAMRDIIIHGSIQEIKENKNEIMRYCDEDVKYLEPIYREQVKEYERLLGSRYNPSILKRDMYNRAEYACRSVHIETVGYPINRDMVKNFSESVPSIMWECQTEIVSLFPDNPPFHRRGKKKSDVSYSLDTKVIKEEIKKWLKKNPKSKWMLTDTKDISLSRKAFDRHFNFKHTYPKDHYFAQVIRYLNLKQNLNGFLPKKQGSKTKSFWEYVGSDDFVRPYMGIYGAQSSRSQPSASGFIPLKSAWMRCMIEPPEGKAIVGIDYSSQEYLISALIYRDFKMLEAYDSGDVYLAYGKDISYIPQEGNKKTHPEKRDNCKAVVLGLSYDMTEFGLAKDLSEKFGRTVTPEEALRWINKHKRAYPSLWNGKGRLQNKYRAQKFIRLPDGWYMWGDNDNFRSVGNVPVQGFGACIMRKAVALAQDAGLEVVYTLHDALYIMIDSWDYEKIDLLGKCMFDAFKFYFEGEMRDRANVRLEADIWSPDYPEEIEKWTTPWGIPVKRQKRYIDERGREEYHKFERFFGPMNLIEEEF